MVPVPAVARPPVAPVAAAAAPVHEVGAAAPVHDLPLLKGILEFFFGIYFCLFFVLNENYLFRL